LGVEELKDGKIKEKVEGLGQKRVSKWLAFGQPFVESVEVLHPK
jgi:hypothetical protein